MLILDEAHVASGASNLSATVGQAVANSDAVLYASATPPQGVSNFAIYNKIFPDSVDLRTLPDTLKAGGEALQEAISTQHGSRRVLIRREHDFEADLPHAQS
ncbi:DEAD/DEAH box helicase family protein [Aeromonas veronii]|uniref:DEAD/DEAH box helicase family protein n=1 Tax=Aeromonas veronii TaxID=654 RepID=UPI001F0B2FE4|nr:DEAD/DEAH box helicase family protein [Aeromonas veronii]